MTEKLLRLVGPLHIVGGLLLFATGFSPAAQEFLKSLIAGGDETIWSPFFASVLGPTIASWGVLFTALANQYLASPSISLWRGMVFSVVIWAPLDTILCLSYGIYAGAVVNATVVVLLAWLLLSARKALH